LGCTGDPSEGSVQCPLPSGAPVGIVRQHCPVYESKWSVTNIFVLQDTNESFTLAKVCKYIPIHVHYVLMAGSSSSSWAHVPVFTRTLRYVMDFSTAVVVITLYMSTTPK